MFDFVRNHSRLMLGLMVLLIFPSFVFFGIQGYSRFQDEAAAEVARVDGREINRSEWDAAHQRQVERLRQQMPGVDLKLFDTPEFRRQTLDAIIRERVLAAAADRQHLQPGDDRLKRLFVQDPQFANVRNPDNTVNKAILSAQGMSSEQFAQQLRREYALQQVTQGISQTGLAPQVLAAVSLDALLQRREVEFERFDASAQVAKVNPGDADLESYYKERRTEFMAAEQATIEYVVLDLAAIGSGITLAEEELRKHYNENLSRFTAAEERRASHILINADKAAPAAERQKARERAEALLAELRKSPGSFADMARKHSQDSGSAANGGDLDFFGRGAMVKPFEDVVFAMKPDEISNVVETDFGFHIIRLAAARGGERKPFETVRSEIEAEVRRQLAQKRYPEAAEQFTNMVYEQSDSLQAVVDKFKLEKKQATVQRDPAPDAKDPLASTKLLQAVFGNDAVRNKRNTDAVEVAPNQLASARIVSHQPARQRELAEVRDSVRARVVAQQAAAQARKDGEARLAAARQNEAALPGKAVVSRPQMQGLPRQAVDAILAADASKLPAVVGVDLGEQGYLVARIVRVLPRETPPGSDAQWMSQIGQAFAQAESQAYVKALELRFKTKVRQEAVSRAASAAGG
jgi:peptidyl-prolyl cis-trans isomerase D